MGFPLSSEKINECILTDVTAHVYMRAPFAAALEEFNYKSPDPFVLTMLKDKAVCILLCIVVHKSH